MTVSVTAMLLCGVSVLVLPTAADTTSKTNRIVDVHWATNHIANATNVLPTAKNGISNGIARTESQKLSVFVVYDDSPSDTFDLEDWAESLMDEKQGLYVKNGFILAVIKAHDNNEYISPFRRIQNQFMAYKMLREQYPDLPSKVENLGGRVLVDKTDYDENVYIIAFLSKDIHKLRKKTKSDE
ncbi:MAG: hypothetical protein J6U40_10320 [Kiritimatiellae bacterium]|nr:hypothetical protein [Kiritimatiellia bacterium]